jgi:hypothetical protein
MGSAVSRRALIQGSVSAVALLWISPRVWAVSVSGKTGRCHQGIDCSGSPEFCATTCLCATDASGQLVCVGCLDSRCHDFTKCQSNSDCPRGSRCITDACCRSAVCIPKCGNPCPPASRPRSLQLWHPSA